MRDQLFGREITGYRNVRRATLLLAAAACISVVASPATAQKAATTEQKVQQVERTVVNMGGFGWGIGIATNFDVGGRRVGTAAVDGNNIVRVDDSSSNASVSFVLEAHYFLQSFNRALVRGSACADGREDWINCTTIAHGPFVAIEMGGGGNATTNSGPISGYALGWMVGMRHPYAPLTSPDSKSSWNFGVGLRVTPNAKVLGDGITANQPLPAGDTLRYKTEPRYGVMLMSTFSF